MQLHLMPKKELKKIKTNTFGGVSLKKRRKVARPLVEGAITHLVLKSNKAIGRQSFYAHKKLVHQLLKERAKKYLIEVMDYVNMGNHLHLKVRFKDRQRFANFLKVFTGLLARKITGSHRGTKLGHRFWDGLAFTRVLASRFEELTLSFYFTANHKERELGVSARKDYWRNINSFLYKLKSVRAAPPNLSSVTLNEGISN